MVTPAYANIVANLDLKAGTDSQLQNAFRTNASVQGNQLFNSIRFYLAYLKEIGYEFSPHFGVGRAAVKPKPRVPKQKTNLQGDGDNGGDELLDDNSGDIKRVKFEIPILGKGSAVIFVPENIGKNDWGMVKAMLDAYVSHLTESFESEY